MEINEFQVPVEDRGVFVKFMAYLARADNKVSIEEKNFCNQSGFLLLVIPMSITVDNLQ